MPSSTRESHSRTRALSSQMRPRRSSPLLPTFVRLSQGASASLAHVAALAGLLSISLALASPDPPPVLLAAFVSLTCASVPALLYVFLSGESAQFTRASRRSLGLSVLAATLAASRVAFLLFSLGTIGLTRLLVASGAVAPILGDLGTAISLSRPFSTKPLDRRRAARAMLIVFLSVWLVAYDATGGRAPAERAEIVKQHVMKTRAGHAVGAGLHSLASAFRPRLSRPGLLYARLASRRSNGAAGDVPVPVTEVQRKPDEVDRQHIENGSSSNSESSRGESPKIDRGEVAEGDPRAPGDPEKVLQRVDSAVGAKKESNDASGFVSDPGGRSGTLRRVLSAIAGESGTTGSGHPLDVPPDIGQGGLTRQGGLLESEPAIASRGRRTMGRRVRRLLATAVDAPEAEAKDANEANAVDINGLHANTGDTPGSGDGNSRESDIAGSARLAFAGDVRSEEVEGRVGTETDPTRTSLAGGFFGITLAVLSLCGASLERDTMEKLSSDLGSHALAQTHTFVGAATLLLPFIVGVRACSGSDGQDFHTGLLAACNWKVGLFAILFLNTSQLLLLERRRRGGANRIPIAPGASQSCRDLQKGTVHTGSSEASGGRASFELASRQARAAFAQYFVILAVLPFMREIEFVANAEVIPFSFSLWLSASALFLLLYFNWKITGEHRPRATVRSRLTTNAGTEGPLLSLGLASRSSLSAMPVLYHKIARALSRASVFIAQSRRHKASWQVFNFLVMQSVMVVVETAYAFMTDSVGLISISADNMFCCLALGAGLFAIRATASQKRSVQFSFGLARLESLCGFVNGILLLVVAVLLLLEAIDRVINPELIDANHIFAVCLVGILGNGFGLVFFPPESRRENHNVQSIYLHIWANTLAYAGISASAVVLGRNPSWRMSELFVALFVAATVVVCAVPLLLRSSRLLMNLPAPERVKDIQAARVALSRLDGVIHIADFRIWNLTPSSMVSIVHLVVAPASHVQDNDVFLQARSICIALGASIDHSTIQISREENDGLVFQAHSRSVGSLDVEGLTSHLAASLSRTTE
jgi:cobalt-zinc-cadmium efflux system protein